MRELTWWGYLHTSGTVQVKRFFDMEDLYEADTSPFVVRRTGVIPANSREDAEIKIREQLAIIDDKTLR